MHPQTMHKILPFIWGLSKHFCHICHGSVEIGKDGTHGADYNRSVRGEMNEWRSNLLILDLAGLGNPSMLWMLAAMLARLFSLNTHIHQIFFLLKIFTSHQRRQKLFTIGCTYLTSFKKGNEIKVRLQKKLQHYFGIPPLLGDPRSTCFEGWICEKKKLVGCFLGRFKGYFLG